MDYKEMWEELRQKLNNAKIQIELLVEKVEDNNEERIRLNGKREGVKLVISYMNDILRLCGIPEEGTNVFMIATPNGFVESVQTTKIIRVPYARYMEHRLGKDVFLAEKDATVEYNKMFGIQ
jgi:hypothetical protein